MVDGALRPRAPVARKTPASPAGVFVSGVGHLTEASGSRAPSRLQYAPGDGGEHDEVVVGRFGSRGEQYFAASREEALAKLAILDTAEVACIGIDNLSGEPYRATERWYVQAAAPLQIVE